MRDQPVSSRPVAGALCSGALIGCLLLAALGALAPSAFGAPTDMVDLGGAAGYAALSGASVGNTVSAPGAAHTTLHGDLGVKANTQPTGFPPGVVTGTVQVGNAAAAAAHADVVAAYAAVAGRTGGVPLAGALVGTTVGPGLHTIAGAVSNTGTVTLDAGGDAGAVFVFQVDGAMAMAAGSHVVLAGGAQASRVFWQVNGAGAIGANASFVGTLMALDAVDVGNGSVVNGRVFARNGALTLDADDVYSAPPAIAIAGGPAAITTDTTPTISGTTDAEAPAVVTVTVHGQTLTAVPSGGAWSVTSAILANATYAVTASVGDGAGNTGVAAQQLTVDTVPPVITLAGAASVTTDDPTPTIAGTSDVAPGTVVRVAVGTQALAALVNAQGRWNVTPDALADDVYAVTASVTDPAGNPATATQSLTVDTTAPALVIAGGSGALTNDATPTISGTAAVAAGTVVTVDVADATLSGVVQGDGRWSVTTAALSDGPHRAVADVADTAGNPARAVQTLTVDTVAPAVAIAGGAAATTGQDAPTIAGTSDAAPGTTVTVSIAGRTLTALLQADGTWNATPAFVGAGTWPVTATAADPAGNVGRAAQSLTIAHAVAAGPAPAAFTPPAAVPTPGVPAGPAPTPTPSAPAPSDATAGVTVTRAATRKVGGSRLSIPTTVTASSAGDVTVTAHGTIRIKGTATAIPLTTATVKLAAGRTATLKLSARGTTKAAHAALTRVKAALTAARPVTATVTITVTDAAGHVRTLDRTVRLTR